MAAIGRTAISGDPTIRSSGLCANILRPRVRWLLTSISGKTLWSPIAGKSATKASRTRNSPERARCSGQQFLLNLSRHVRQAEVTPLVPERQTLVIQTETVQKGGVK